MTFNVVLSTQMQNVNMRSSKLTIKSYAQKQMARFGFEHKYHDLSILSLIFFFHILRMCYTLEVIIK